MASKQIDRIGFGQVEMNQVAAMITGQLLDQLPVDTETMGTILEQGRFAKYDAVAKKVNLTGQGKWMLVYNEEEFYDERDGYHKDYAMKVEDRLSGEIVPRLYMPLVGDIFTTNTFAPNLEGNKNTEITGLLIDETDIIGVDPATGYLTNAGYDTAGPLYEVKKLYTMPDGQPGVKLHCIQA